MYDEKPISMSVKDFLIRKLAIKLLTEEKTIEAVVHHQFLSALSATQSNNEIEMSGFGKFYFNTKKAIKKYEKQLMKIAYFTKQLEDVNITEAKKASLTNKLDNAVAMADSLKPKISDEYFASLRGVEEQCVQEL
jgi:nucleoid DNA-binding protein